MNEKPNHDDAVMELIAKLYSFMDEDEKESWSMKAAETMVADQHRYEIDNGLEPLGEYDPSDFYETIQELIEQDADFD